MPSDPSDSFDSSASFGEHLRRARQVAGLTQAELAERAGLSWRGVNDLERGVRRRPRRDTVALLAAALGLAGEERATFEAAAHAAQASASPSAPPLPSPPSPPPQDRDRGVRPPSAPPSPLPIPPTPLIGREHEEAAVTHLLQQHDVRLLTLTGAPGIGKTRLALQVAAGMGDTFADGVVFVGLAAIHDPALVLSALAQALGVHDTGSQPLHETLVAYLRERRLLLVLDNLEQVVTAAPQLADLLASCPQLTLLVTSRTALRLRGEQEFAVPPLGLPDPGPVLPPPEELLQYAGVALFVHRARAVKPTFALTATLAPTVVVICRRLDGLPLALELAAARIKLLPAGELLRRLEHSLGVLGGGAQDLPDRQRTLRCAIAWSYDLLSEAEQALFRRLSVFVGGFTLQMAEGVCQERQEPDGGSAETPEMPDLLDLLATLVDKSVVIPLEPTANGEARFGLLETLREYGLECMEASGEWEVYRRRHAHFLAHRVEQGLPGEHDRVVLDRIEEELGNFRAALEWAREQGEAEVGLRLLGVVWWFWYARGPLDEGIAWLEALLGLDRADIHAGHLPVAAPVAASVRARALRGLALLKGWKGDFKQAMALYEDYLALGREMGDTEEIAVALNGLANTALHQEDFERAQSLYEESWALARTLDNPAVILRPWLGLATIALERGAYAQVEALCTEVLACPTAERVDYNAADAVADLGQVHLRQGVLARAAPLFEESGRRFRDLGAKRGIALALRLQAQVAYRSGALDRAEALLDESLAMYREQGVKSGVAYTLAALADVACVRGDYARAAVLYQESLAHHRMTHARLGPILGLEGLARVAHRQGRLEDAVRLWAATQAQRAMLGTPMWPIDRPAYERDLATLREALGEEQWAAADAAGRALSLDGAIEQGLGESR